MNIKNVTFRRIIIYLRSYFEYRKQTKNPKVFNIPSDEKSIVIQISDSRIYKRYFYTFLKFLSLAGYSIYFPDVNFRYYRFNIYNKKNNLYRLTFDEQFIIFNNPPNNSEVVLHIDDKKLNHDYFFPIFLKQYQKNHYNIPMAMHPLMYYENLWNVPLNVNIKKKKSVFMAGTIEHPAYSMIKEKPFSIESRTDIYNYLRKQHYLKNINSKEKLFTFIKSNDDFVCILLDSTKTPIPMQELRNIFNKFSFFLALPGVFMPLCHNLIEALSTGAIPIIHKSYANLMTPKFKHMHDAIIYENLSDLKFQIDLAYKMDDAILKKLQYNVSQYYNLNLTPKSVTNKIILNKYDCLYLLAGTDSVELLEDYLNN